MNDLSTRIRRILSRPEPPTGTELTQRLERHRLPDTIEQIEAGKKENRATTATKQRLLFNPCEYE